MAISWKWLRLLNAFQNRVWTYLSAGKAAAQDIGSTQLGDQQ